MPVKWWYNFHEFGGHLANVVLSIPLRAGLRTNEETKPLFLASLLAASLSLAAAFPVVGHFGLYGVIFGPLIIHVMMQALLWRAFIRGARGATG